MQANVIQCNANANVMQCKKSLQGNFEMRQPPRADATTVRCKTVQRKTKEQQSNFWLSVFAAIAIVIAVAIAAIVLRKKIPSKCEACSVPCFLFLLLTLFVNTMCAPSIVLHYCMSIVYVYYTLYNTRFICCGDITEIVCRLLLKQAVPGKHCLQTDKISQSFEIPVFIQNFLKL